MTNLNEFQKALEDAEKKVVRVLDTPDTPDGPGVSETALKDKMATETAKILAPLFYNFVEQKIIELDTTKTDVPPVINQTTIVEGGDASAPYLLTENTSSLTNGRVMTAGSGIQFTDGGAQNTFTIATSLVAGPNITFGTQGNSIVISGSAGSGSGGGGDPGASYLVMSSTASLINERVFTAGVGIGFADNGANSTLVVSASILAGVFTTLSTSGNSIVISSSAPTRQTIATYNITSASSGSPLVCGQTEFVPSEHLRSSIILKAIMSVQTGSNTAFVKLYNITSGTYVHIGGVGITALSTSNQTPTAMSSVNLVNATNFSTASAIYEAQLYAQANTSNVFLGGCLFTCT